MANNRQIKRKWRRVLERWCRPDEGGPSIKLGAGLYKGECVFQAPDGLHLLVHTNATTFCGEYVIKTADHLILGLLTEGRSLSFVEGGNDHGA
jgi:hypothetical protein